MLTGIKLKSNTTPRQKVILSRWMASARFIWNAKCEKNDYLSKFSMRYMPIGNYPPIDQTYSQCKTELSSWLFECPSQILRNSASNWFQTYQNYQKGPCRKPRKKRKTDTSSVHLTKELFKFEKRDDGVTRLFIGTKKNNPGCLSIKINSPYKTPNLLMISRKNGAYQVSFCDEDEVNIVLLKVKFGENFNEKVRYVR
jgi:putative transposase